DAAEETRRTPNEADFALCISCVGRRIVLGQRIEDETEGVRALLGDNVALAGFYSYGELAPSRTGAACALHNQTMTITTFAEQG
ncbi:MAG: FIST C-terminal domain-containing protein, partial [Bacteroidota bacterium]